MPSAIRHTMPWPFGGISWTGDAAVVLANRAHPVVGVRGEVGARDRAAGLLRVRLDLLGELAAVEGFTLRRRDLLERLRLVGEAEDLAGARRAPTRQEGLSEAGLVAQLGHLRVQRSATKGDTG